MMKMKDKRKRKMRTMMRIIMIRVPEKRLNKRSWNLKTHYLN